ncbi:PREDICTED: telomeric repeat-binding factor 1 [Cyprinodon variegatus]|nr:PREDICTED: telomeric repeat-binding factor 1 [Cyprinodon variegatus]
MGFENEKIVPELSEADGNISFSEVTTVASGMMLDFLFVTLCRNFKAGNFDEFNETLLVFKALSECESLQAAVNDEKSMICAFLARVMHGKQLDVLFEEDESVMPLMSAATVWANLQHTVGDEDLFKRINVHLLVQAVAACLENGRISSASSVIKWFEKRNKFPQNLRVKLSVIVKKMETHHPFLMSHSYDHLRETIQSFLDNYLKKNPSDFLVKAATKLVQSSQNNKDSKPVFVESSALPEQPHEMEKKNKKPKRKLFSTKTTDMWMPDTMATPCVSLRRLSRNELCQLMTRCLDTPKLEKNEKQKKRKTPKKWNAQLDRYLKEGVRRHGRGKWAQILLDYDFEGRTGTMLKDRWRVLLRANKVD